MATIVLPSPPPDASATVKGLVNLTAQSFAGLKTFTGGISAASLTAGNFSFSGNNVDLTGAGTMGIGTGATATTITIGDPGIINTSVINLTATSYINNVSPTAYFHQAPATVGSPLINSSALDLRMTYWSAGAQTYDIALQGVMDSVTPTAHLSFQFGGTEKYRISNIGNIGFAGGAIMTALQQSGVGATSFTIQSWPTDGAGSIGLIFDTAVAVSTGKLLSIRNNGTELGYIDNFSGNGFRITGGHAAPMYIGDGPVVLGYTYGSGGITVDVSNVSPNNDNVLALGGAGGRRWTNVHALGVDSGASTLALSTTVALGNTGFTFNHTNAASTDRIASFQVGGTEYFYVQYYGTDTRIGPGSSKAALEIGSPNFNSSILINNSTVQLISGSTEIDVTTGVMRPLADGVVTAGDATHRWLNVYAVNHIGSTVTIEAQTNSTAIAKFQDQNAKTRFGVDSQGLPSLGSYHYKAEDFGSMTGSYVTSGFVGSTGWVSAVAGTGLGVKYLNNTGTDTTSPIGGGAFIDPSSTASGASYFFNNANLMLHQNTSTVAVWEWSAMFPALTSNVNSIMGIYASNSVAHPNGFGFWWGGSGNWQWFTDNGTTRTITALSSPVAPTASRFQRFRIEFFGSGSPLGANTVKLYIDGTLVQTITGASVVLNSTGQIFGCGTQCQATASAPYLAIANWSVWYSLVTTPFAP